MATRQTLYNGEGLYFLSLTDGVVRLQALDDSLDWGSEAGAWLRLQLGRLLMVQTEAELFLPLDTALSHDAVLRPVFLCTGSLSLRLSQWASLVYSATLHRDDAAIEELQFRHFLNLRFHYAIF
jgi:hypothetical protein